MSDKTQQYFQRLARENTCRGVLYEPRIYYATVDFSIGDRYQFPEPGIFANGEQFPVRITDIVSIMATDTDNNPNSPSVTPAQGDERLINRYGLRVRSNDVFYQASDYIPLPLWHNVNVTAPEIITSGNASWSFDHPVPFGARDSLQIHVALRNSPTAGHRKVGVSFQGVGRASGRPYHFGSTKNLTDESRAQLDVDDFRNEGAEIIDIYEMTVHCGAQSNASDPAGDIRELKLNIIQHGNGTNIAWGQGPIVTNSGGQDSKEQALCPAGLFGRTISRGVVHHLPGNGWIWQPGQGVDIELESFDTSRNAIESVDIAMLGYIIVT